MEGLALTDEPMDDISVSSQVMDENIVSVVLKEETADKFNHVYIEDICSGTFGKVFLPIGSHEVDFTDEMVKLELDSQAGGLPHTWAVQLATATLCERVERAEVGQLIDKSVDNEEQSSLQGGQSSEDSTRGSPRLSPQPKFYKIQCSICKKWFLNNDSMITHLRNHCGDRGNVVGTVDQCQVCQQSFQDNASLNAHMLTHVGMNPIECNVCQKRFAYKWCLRNHVQTHGIAANKHFDACCPPVGATTLGVAYGTFENSVETTRKMYSDRPSIIDDRRKDAIGTIKVETEARGGLRCDVCKMRFKDRDSLNRHTLVHMSEGPYKYDIFSSTFRDKPDTNLRTSSQTPGIKQFKCSLCERSFAQRTALNNHMLAHSGEKPHACNICEKTYKRKSELIRHTMVHTGERPYECKECLMTFREKAKLNSHMLVHTGEKPHECYICHKACARKSDLNSHMLSHTGGQYDCKICDKIFTRKSDLNRHTLIHTGEKPFACELCDMAFRERTRLNSHMLVHTGDKRHACHICSKTFREKSSLKKHMLIHTGDRPYECFVCKKTFTQKTTLNSHVLVHTGERPYECEACPKAFRERSSLKKHSSFHTERDHECNVCFKKFTHKADLGAHTAIEHPS